jgi:hypothetical protein
MRSLIKEMTVNNKQILEAEKYSGNKISRMRQSLPHR